MDDQFNTTAGWVLFAGIVALGLSSISGHYFGANKPHRPHEMGYAIEGVVSSEGGEAAVPLETLLASADTAKGEQSFKKCLSCHTINQGGATGQGPNLYGVVGKPVGKHAAGFAYSSALSGHGGDWSFANLNEWLTSPKKFAAGTKMTFAGMSNPEERANLMAYLNAQGSNLPMPAAPAAEAAPAAADAAKAGASEAAAAAPSEAAKH
jgi:cytochrome c